MNQFGWYLVLDLVNLVNLVIENAIECQFSFSVHHIDLSISSMRLGSLVNKVGWVFVEKLNTLKLKSMKN